MEKMEKQLQQVQNLGINEYHGGPGISASQIKKAIKSTAHFFLEDEKSTERNPNFDMGNAFELLLTEPENFYKSVLIFDTEARPDPTKSFAAKVNKEWKAEILQSEKIVIDTQQFEALQLMVQSCKNDENINSTLKGAKLQLSLFWHDPETGLLLKSRPDVVRYLNEKTVIVNDIKTAQDGSPEGFSKAFANLNYGIQAATQVDAVESALNVKVDHYTYTVVEKLPPYLAQVYVLNSEEINFYRQIYKSILKRIKRAQDDEQYKAAGYGENASGRAGILELNVPRWHSINLENKFL